MSKKFELPDAFKTNLKSQTEKLLEQDVISELDSLLCPMNVDAESLGLTSREFCIQGRHEGIYLLQYYRRFDDRLLYRPKGHIDFNEEKRDQLKKGANAWQE